jgi:hypothetical protein
VAILYLRRYPLMSLFDFSTSSSIQPAFFISWRLATKSSNPRRAASDEFCGEYTWWSARQRGRSIVISCSVTADCSRVGSARRAITKEVRKAARKQACLCLSHSSPLR